MTVNETMELVEEYARDIEDIAYSEAVFAHVDKRRYAGRDKSFAELRTAIEELNKDASRYQFMKHCSRAFGLDISGNHSWTCQITRNDIRGATLDEAIDAAMREST